MKSPYDIEGINPGEVFNQSQDFAKHSPDVPLIPLELVTWPEFNEYGIDHHRQSAILASHIARQMNLPKNDIDACWIAGLLHDSARIKPFGVADPDHGIRAANRVESILKSTPYWSDKKLITTACWLIANHSVGDETDNKINDPALRALVDADRFESARISPGTPKGAQIMKEILQDQNKYFFTDFGRDKNALRTWMTHRGWK